MTPQQRIDAYKKAFPKFPPPYLVGDRIEGLWIMGNNYRTSGYYGAYPHGYLDRVHAMFPLEIGDPAMHIFSGSLPKDDRYIRFDIRPDVKPDVVCDVHKLSEVTSRQYSLILADPPYSVEDAEHYGQPMVRRKVVFDECMKVLMPGGWLIWLDQAFPMFSKKVCRLGMAIGMIKSTNHRVRAVFGFQKH